MKKQSTAKGFAILSAATFLGKVLSLLYIPFLLIILGTPGYAAYSVVYTVFIFVFTVTNSGVSVAVSKVVSEFIANENYKDAYKSFKIARTIMILIGFIMMIFMIFTANGISNNLGYPESAKAIIFISPAIFITAIVSVYRGYYQGKHNMSPTAISQIGEQLINVVFSLFFAYIFIGKGTVKNIEWGIAGATIGTTVGALFSLIFLMITANKTKHTLLHKQGIKRNCSKDILKSLLKYIVPISIAQCFINGGAIVDVWNVNQRLLVAGFEIKATKEAFALLVNYNTLILVPITLITALSMAVLPALSEAVAMNEHKEVENRVNYALKLCILLAVPFSVGFGVLSKPIYKVLFPSIAEQGFHLMLFGSALVLLWSIVQIESTIIQGVGRPTVATIFMVTAIAVKIVMNYFLISIKSINIYGAIISSITAYIIALILSTRYIKKHIGINIKFKRQTFKSVLSGIIMGIATLATYSVLYTLLSFIVRSSAENIGRSTEFLAWTINFMSLIISSPVAIYTYLTCLILTKGISKKDINSISPKIFKIIPMRLKERLH